ncbi:MAG TPA: KpsF/GutQ family sugar-phosphate isomerase [Stellaceae bacterium]|nr:KpsF/GutQ family sugar-phosphate isomerase [Stellaceae bacterium]
MPVDRSSVVAAPQLAALDRQSGGETGLEVARRVIRAEINGLEGLAVSLDGSFETAVDACAAVGGRIVVTGVGKSGHVGRKIAATLASTGTPAQFVHPVEASHGDLGMIGSDDAILALSNSGETSELADIVAYSRRFEIRLIAITGGAGSTLAGAADIVLLLPSAAEACPMGLAPTTSATMMMTLGDALAIALLERKGFSSADFRLFHPGGRLGRRLLRVRDIMHTGHETPLISPGAPMSEAILVMTAKSFGCIGVCDSGGRLVGVITDGDLRRHMDRSLLARTVAEVMHRNPRTIAATALAADALGLMNRFAITSLFVFDKDDRPIGFLHMHDCLRAGVA